MNAPTNHTEIQLSSINNDFFDQNNFLTLNIQIEMSEKMTDQFWHSIDNSTFIFLRQNDFFIHRWLIHWLMSNCDTELTPRDTKGVIT